MIVYMPIQYLFLHASVYYYNSYAILVSCILITIYIAIKINLIMDIYFSFFLLQVRFVVYYFYVCVLLY